MRRFAMGILSGLAACLLLSTLAFAGGRNPADYPLRVHVYQYNQTQHYHLGVVDYVDGEGRANLFENSQPLGFDFGFHCGEQLRYSSGFETFPARWKKQGQKLEILMPQFGKPGEYSACELKVAMKDFAYYRQNGVLNSEPAAAMKQWMDKHQYDPEHGKNEPLPLPPAPANPAPGAVPAPSAAPQTAPKP